MSASTHFGTLYGRLAAIVVVAWAASATDCASDPAVSHGANERQAATAKNPVVPPSEPAKRIQQELGSPRDCGTVVQPLDNEECDVYRIFSCLKDAFGRCDAAHGVHMYAGPEGDAVRVDYFVVPSGGECEYVYVEDKTADPLNKQGLVEVGCKTIEWAMHNTLHGCEILEPSECTPHAIGTGG